MNFRHGQRKKPIYAVWMNMIARCTNPKNTQFADYGGRGISVCPQWRGFIAFYADMGDAPAGSTLERIENDGNYEPGNCRWATRREQGRNKRNNRILKIGGEALPVSAWAERSGLESATIHRRLSLGWSAADAVLLPKVAHRTGIRRGESLHQQAANRSEGSDGNA